MAETPYDLEQVKRVLREATAPGADFSQRSLSKAAGEGRDCVGDIINGRNANPTTKVLLNLATALGGDLTMFGVGERRADPPTEAELERAIHDAWPDMPKRGTTDRRVQYLAQSVARLLKLPQDHPGTTGESVPSAAVEAAPPPVPTTTA